MKINLKTIAKKIIFALLPLLFLCLFLEVAARCLYFEETGKASERLAATLVFNKLRLKVLSKMAEIKIGGLPPEDALGQAFYGPEGLMLRTALKQEYEDNFQQLLSEVTAVGAKLAVLYLPSDNYKHSFGQNELRSFYALLAQKYAVPFLDLTDDFFVFDEEVPMLLPENGHLSRFGNQLVVKKLTALIDQNTDFRALFYFQNRPKLLGGLSPNDQSIWLYDFYMPYRVKTNKQGFRMAYDLTFPKQKQRLLFLGDSFTFGPYLANHETYCGLLQKKYPNKEIINAGVAGYTITDELSLFQERAKFAEPDLVFLQVLDNDLFGLFFLKRNEFDRKRQVKEPTPVEIDFLNKVKNKVQ